MTKYPIGLQNFQGLREDGYVYVDKTAFVYELAQTKDYIYIFEFKINKSADETLAQIKEKKYSKPFEQDRRKLYKIGVNFSTATRRIEEWKMI